MYGREILGEHRQCTSFAGQGPSWCLRVLVVESDPDAAQSPSPQGELFGPGEGEDDGADDDAADAGGLPQAHGVLAAHPPRWPRGEPVPHQDHRHGDQRGQDHCDKRGQARPPIRPIARVGAVSTWFPLRRL